MRDWCVSELDDSGEYLPFLFDRFISMMLSQAPSSWWWNLLTVNFPLSNWSDLGINLTHFSQIWLWVCCTSNLKCRSFSPAVITGTKFPCRASRNLFPGHACTVCGKAVGTWCWGFKSSWWRGCNNSAACFDVNKVHGLWETYQQLGRGFRCEDEN